MKKAGTAISEGQPAGIGGGGRNSSGTITINGGMIEAHTRNCEPAIRADKKYSSIDLGCHMNIEGVFPAHLSIHSRSDICLYDHSSLL